VFNVLDEDVILSLSAAKGKDLCIAVWKECRMHRFFGANSARLRMTSCYSWELEANS